MAFSTELDSHPDTREAAHQFRNTLAAAQDRPRSAFRSFARPTIHDAITIFDAGIQAFAGVHRSPGNHPGDRPWTPRASP